MRRDRSRSTTPHNQQQALSITKLSSVMAVGCTLGLFGPLGCGPVDLEEAELTAITSDGKGVTTQMWIQPDFVVGFGTDAEGRPLETYPLQTMSVPENWTTTAKKSSRIQIFLGFLNNMYEGLPFKGRDGWDLGRGCIRRQVCVESSDQATPPWKLSPSDRRCSKSRDKIDFEQFRSIMNAAKLAHVSIGVETGGIDLSDGIATRGSNPTSILENFRDGQNISLGQFVATRENHILDCFEREFGVQVSNVTIDNPIAMRSYIASQFKYLTVDHGVARGAPIYPRYSLDDVMRELAIYMQHMTYSTALGSGRVIHRRGLKIALTEFGYGVPYVVDPDPNDNVTSFNVGADFIAKYNQLGRREAPQFSFRDGDMQLQTTLGALQRNVNAINQTSPDDRKIKLDAFFIDSSYRYERASRFVGGGSQPLSKPHIPYHKIKSTVQVVRSLGLKVGLYLSFGSYDQEICKDFKSANSGSASCAAVLKQLKRCATPTSTLCAPAPDPNRTDSQGAALDFLRAPDGRLYSTMSLAEIEAANARENYEVFLRNYLDGFHAAGLRADYLDLASWGSSFPEQPGRESTQYSWLWTSKQLADKIVPDEVPPYTGPSSDIYRVPASALLISSRQAPMTTCAFKDSAQYKEYLRIHGIPASTQFNFFINRPTKLNYTGRCTAP